MKKSDIIIVSLNEDLGKSVSKIVAKDLKKIFVDLDEVVKYQLLDSEKVRVTLGDEYLTELEQKLFSDVCDYENAVFFITADTFMANENYKNLVSSKVFYIKDEDISCDIKLKKKELAECNERALIHNSISFYLSKVCANIVDGNDAENVANQILKIIKG